jgi:undecaprenyl-phosphate galactose phosphotransferase
VTSLPKFKNRLGISFLFLGDILAIFVIFHISVLIRTSVLPRVFTNLPEYLYDLKTYSWIFGIWLLILAYEEGYSKRFALWDEVRFLWKSSFFSAVAIFTMLFIMKRGQDYSRALILTMTICSLALFPLIRLYFKRLLYSLGLMKRKILIIGSGAAAVSAYTAIKGEPNLGYEPVGFIDDNAAVAAIDGLKVRKGLGGIERYIKSAGIHDVVVAKPELDKEALAKLINHVQHKAENTLYIPDLTGIAVSGTELRYFFKEQTMIIEISNNLARPLVYTAKRITDYFLGVIILALGSLPMLAIALAVKWDSPGRAFLKQERIGKNGRPFFCYKFRTMYKNAEERLGEILKTDPAAKEEWTKYWKLKNDPRITKIGDFLRKSSLDELPQLLNIVKGEMSLVGPRPYLPREWPHIAQESPIIHALPPGVTGLWQVSGRNNQDYSYRISLDSWYVKNWNLWLDIMIILKTVGVVLKREGAR